MYLCHVCAECSHDVDCEHQHDCDSFAPDCEHCLFDPDCFEYDDDRVDNGED